MASWMYLHIDDPLRAKSHESGDQQVLTLSTRVDDLSVFLGPDEAAAENALVIIEALQDARVRALRRMALRATRDRSPERVIAANDALVAAGADGYAANEEEVAS